MRVAKLAPMTGKVSEEVERFFDRFLAPGFRQESFLPPFPFETAGAEWYPMLDLTETAVRAWVERARADRMNGKTGLTSAEREELTRLRRENRVLQEEREILKKAAAFFAKHHR